MGYLGAWMWGAGTGVERGLVRNTKLKLHNVAKIAPCTRSLMYVKVSKDTSHVLGAAGPGHVCPILVLGVLVLGVTGSTPRRPARLPGA